MNVPVLGKAVALSNLSSIAIAVFAIVPYYEGRINRMAYEVKWEIPVEFSYGRENTVVMNSSPTRVQL
jgi:hypothetical protein